MRAARRGGGSFRSGGAPLAGLVWRHDRCSRTPSFPAFAAWYRRRSCGTCVPAVGCARRGCVPRRRGRRCPSIAGRAAAAAVAGLGPAGCAGRTRHCLVLRHLLLGHGLRAGLGVPNAARIHHVAGQRLPAAGPVPGHGAVRHQPPARGRTAAGVEVGPAPPACCDAAPELPAATVAKSPGAGYVSK